MEKKDDRKFTGRKGEDIAAEYLIKNGFEIITRNFRFGKNEIDIIAKDGNCFTFVEVKSKNDNSDVILETQITAKKQKAIFQVANFYIEKNNLKKEKFRFDVILIIIKNNKNTIEHYKNALMFF